MAAGPVTVLAAEPPAPEAELVEDPLTSADSAPDPASLEAARPAALAGGETGTDETQTLVVSSAVPAPVVTADAAAQVHPDRLQADQMNPETAPAASEQATPPVSTSSRQLKPVKIGWSQDNSWQVKKGAGATLPLVADAGPSSLDDAPPPYVRPLTPAPSPPSRLNPLWLLALVVAAVLVVLLAQRAFRSSRAALNAAACCTVTSRLVGSAGQGLSAPVKVSVLSTPAQSRLKAGALIGQAPGPLSLDVPGQYALKVVGDGYAAQTVTVTVPAVQPLVITLK